MSCVAGTDFALLDHMWSSENVLKRLEPEADTKSCVAGTDFAPFGAHVGWRECFGTFRARGLFEVGLEADAKTCGQVHGYVHAVERDLAHGCDSEERIVGDAVHGC